MVFQVRLKKVLRYNTSIGTLLKMVCICDLCVYMCGVFMYLVGIHQLLFNYASFMDQPFEDPDWRVHYLSF